MRAVRLFLVAVFLLGVASGYQLCRYLNRPVEWPQVSASVDPKIIDAAYDVACTASPGTACRSYGPPTVLFGNLLETRGALGTYAHGVLVLDWRQAEGLADVKHVDAEALGTVIHELVHYIDDREGNLSQGTWRWRRDVRSICASEARAWAVENSWKVAIGAPELAVWDWLVRYPHCQS